ncbi:histidine kinase [Dactylosporangium sp. NPDC049525]|uniref:sensor histidine kinase n=1 Tax=Dactylosporangium sp. NPDC049525 TaxID=3154730 RepID=UPI0034487389
MAMLATDRRLRRARLVALASLATGVGGSLLAPGWLVLREGHLVPVALAGVLAFAAGHAAAVHAALTPWLPESTRSRRLLWYLVTAALSVPLVGVPAGAGAWAWIGASIVGTAPLLGHRGAALLATLGPLVAAGGLGWWHAHDPAGPVLLTAAVGAAIALTSWLQLWFWGLLVELDQGRAAQASLAATEERLRFARDVHDLLGHSLTVIALKAELAARLAPVDAGRAGQEAAEAQRLAAGAITDVHRAVHGYRAVDLAEHLADISRLLRSCGIACTVTTRGTVPPDPAAQLAAVLREATTNVLRHSHATWCTIDIDAGPSGAALTVTNDGAGPYHSSAGAQETPDTHGGGYGLRGLAERLAGAGGTLTHRHDGDRFELRATA